MVFDETGQQFYNMLPLEKNKEIMEQLRRVVSRAEHVREVKNQLFRFINEVEKLNSAFAQKISKEMTKFQEFVIKNSLYYEKTDHIVNLSKLYRQFSLQIERNSKINLVSMQNIRQENIQKVEERLKSRCEGCIKEFQRYSQQELAYNQKYSLYSINCEQLTTITTMYKSYENPISFYQKILTNEYLSALDKKQQECSTNETEVVTSRQMIDQQRGNLTENIKEVNEVYFIFVHSYLDIIDKIVKCIVFPKNDGKIGKTELNLRTTAERDNIEEHQMKELQRLENLYACGNGQSQQANDLFQEFSELFRKSVKQNEISSDHRFFYDRCSSIRGKKLKTSEETYKLQNYLFEELKLQRESYYEYEKTYKQIEKDSFTNNGVESYKKRFRKYFGANYAQTLELCLNLIERQKKSLEKICKNMQEGHEKMKKVLENKREALNAFERRSNIILQDHMRIKERTFSKETISADELHRFQTSIAESFNQLKKVFIELEKSEQEEDKRYFLNLKSLYETILKEATNKNLNKLLQKQKNRINILNGISIDRETLSILKQDARYENLLNECPKPNLYSTFVSLINKVQVEQTTLLLKKKQARLKNMIKPKVGCCGMKSEVIKQKVHSQHDCKLRSEKQKYKGVLNISELGLIFQEKTWNPFGEGLQLVIPQSDIKSFDLKQFQQKEVVEIDTEFGALNFQSKQNATILKSIQNNINFKPMKEMSERGKRNDSASFIKNNTSTQFKISFDKTLNSNELSKVIKNVNLKLPPEKPANKLKSAQNQLKDLARKWRDGQFLLPEKFTRVQKAEKNEMRRDYQYKHGHSKFYLKERRECKIVEKDLLMKYQWKISFPESPMLHSFRHHQQIRVQTAAKEPIRVRIISARYFQQQLYIKNKFYKEIEDMNKLVSQFIVLVLEKEADVINEQEEDQHKSVESFNIVIDDINLEERESKFEKADSFLRNSRMERIRTSANTKNSL